MIKIKAGGNYVDFESATWSGTDTQCSRTLEFTVPSNPYDKNFTNPSIKLGDIVYLYEDGKIIFVGTITTRDRTAEVGTADYTAMDFMHHLLRSNGTYIFKKTTAEAIAQKLCSQLKIKVGSVARTKINIDKMIFEDQCIYDIIIKAYRNASAFTGKKYMPQMDGKLFCVIEKGKDSGVTLEQSNDITDAEYTDTTDNIVNVVKIYNEKRKNIGSVSTSDKYGIYQQTYMKESKEKHTKEKAKALLCGVTKEASVTSCIGNVKAVSGKSIIIKDSATKLSGKFYITSDEHTFENGIHTMTLSLAWKETMEAGADVEKDKKSIKKKLKNASTAYYFESGTVYHSSKNCPACKNNQKALKSSTVAKLKKVKNQNQKRKYRPCSKCWEG